MLKPVYKSSSRLVIDVHGVVNRAPFTQVFDRMLKSKLHKDYGYKVENNLTVFDLNYLLLWLK